MPNTNLVRRTERRGTESAAAASVLMEAELGVMTDVKKLFVGDGSRAGGYTLTPDNIVTIWPDQANADKPLSLAWWIARADGGNLSLRLPKGTYSVAADLTVPANITLVLDAGAVFHVASGKTLTLNCAVNKESISNSGAGTITDNAERPFATNTVFAALQAIVNAAAEAGQIGGAVSISTAINYNDYTTPGIYYPYSATAHENAPPQLLNAQGKYIGGLLIVLRGKNVTSFRQIVFPTSSIFTAYSRYYNGSTWTSWYSILDSPITFVTTTGLDLNTYLANGTYAFTTTAASGGTNFPNTTTSGTLHVVGNNSSNVMQIYITYTNMVYIRHGSTSGFGNWIKIGLPYAQTTEGIGQFLSVDVAAGTAYSLPAGGTWEYDIFAVNSSGAIVDHKADVKAGGTEIFAADAYKAYYGHAKRVF